MSLDKFVSRGFTASTGGGLDTWVAKTSPSPSANTPAPVGTGSGSSFVLGGSPSSRVGSSRAGEAMGGRGMDYHSRTGASRGATEAGAPRDTFERRSLAENTILSLFPKSDPRTVLSLLFVLGLSVVGYVLLRITGVTQNDNSDGYGRAVQSEIAERRSRFR